MAGTVMQVVQAVSSQEHLQFLLVQPIHSSWDQAVASLFKPIMVAVEAPLGPAAAEVVARRFEMWQTQPILLQRVALVVALRIAREQ